MDPLITNAGGRPPFESWRVFRIMAEFIDGFDGMAEVGPAVAVFGSARTKKRSVEYKQAVEIGRLLVEAGYGVITGGGPGTMEAANKGANQAGGKSIGLNISLPHEQGSNPFVKLGINFRYFFVRKVMFVKYCNAIIGLPGGFGTMDEFFEAMTLIQTGKVRQVPIVLVGRDFWKGLIQWIKKTLLADGMISKKDLDLFVIVDTPEQAVSHIVEYYISNEHEDRFPI